MESQFGLLCRVQSIKASRLLPEPRKRRGAAQHISVPRASPKTRASGFWRDALGGRLPAMDGLNLRPPFARWADRCTRRPVETMLSSSGRSTCADRVANTRVHRLRRLQRLNRMQIVVGSPYTGGRSCQRQPESNTLMMLLITRRTFIRRATGWLFESNGSIAAQA